MSRRNGNIFEDSGDEAIESKEQLEEDDIIPQSEEEGEDLMDNAEKDYQKIAELDIYEDEGVEDEDIYLNPEARKRAEMALNKRDLANREVDMDEYFYEDEDDEAAELKRRREYYWRDDEEEELDERRYLDPEECRGQLHIWIQE